MSQETTDNLAAAARDQLDLLIGLIREMTSAESCTFDHSGYCQAHYHQPPCPHGRAQTLLASKENKIADAVYVQCQSCGLVREMDIYEPCECWSKPTATFKAWVVVETPADSWGQNEVLAEMKQEGADIYESPVRE